MEYDTQRDSGSCGFGTLFGMIECDECLPADLREHFAEMLPIFKNALVTRDNIGPHMREYAKEYNIPKKPRRMLVGSYRGDKILLATPLLRSPTGSPLNTSTKSSSTKRIPDSNALGSPSPQPDAVVTKILTKPLFPTP